MHEVDIRIGLTRASFMIDKPAFNSKVIGSWFAHGTS
jgi:hypothetical protein